MGLLAMMRDAEDAPQALHDALSWMYTKRDWMNVWPIVEATAMYWARTGRPEPAGVLLGHLEANDVHHAMFVSERQHASVALRRHPSAGSWTAQGRDLDRDQVVAYALSQLTPPAKATSP